MWWVAHSTDKRMRAELLEQARIAAQAINIERVASLSGSEKDLNTPAYQRIKSQLALMRKARHQCRFLYLMGQQSDGAVFFFVDSLPADSENYAPPGLVYEEVSDFYLRTFDTKQEAVVGPVTDRWGTLVTALIPLRAPHTGNLVAVLGMDVDAKDWNKEILGRCFIPFAAMLLFAVLILLIASREQAVKARRESEEKHRLFFENSPIGIIHYDNQGIITDVNEAMITTFGSSREKLIGLDIEDIPDKMFGNEVSKSLNGEFGYYEGEYISYTGGKTSIIKANWIPISRDGNVIAGVGIVEDITARKRAEEALRESEEKFRFITESVADIVWVLDRDFRTSYVSPSIEKVLGVTPEERKRQSLEEMITPESLQRVQMNFLEELQRDKDGVSNPDRSVTIEVEYYHKNGSTVWMENIVNAIRGPGGAIVRMHGVSRDITDRKKAEDEREKLIKELQEALKEIKTLRGILPICSFCKKIRDDKGYWEQVDVYIHKHSQADFSHSICPECAKEHYPDLDIYE